MSQFAGNRICHGLITGDMSKLSQPRKGGRNKPNHQLSSSAYFDHPFGGGRKKPSSHYWDLNYVSASHRVASRLHGRNDIPEMFEFLILFNYVDAVVSAWHLLDS